jgi:hypothetical protein
MKAEKPDVVVKIIRTHYVSLRGQVWNLAKPGQQRRSLLGMLTHKRGIFGVENWLEKRLREGAAARHESATFIVQAIARGNGLLDGQRTTVD